LPFTATGLREAIYGNLTATATDLTTSDTSEFSADLLLPYANPGSTYTVNEGESVTFDAGVDRNPRGLPLTFTWYFGGSPDPIATGMHPTLTWDRLVELGYGDGPGGNLVYVVVSDTAGDISFVGPGSFQPANLSVRNAPPSVAVTGPSEAVAGDPLTFTLTA